MSKYSNFDPTHFVVEPEETEQITQLNQLLNREIPTRLVTEQGENVHIPESVLMVLRYSVAALASGQVIQLNVTPQDLTIEEAANLLNVSNSYLIKLLEQRQILSTNVGSDRRIKREDLLIYKERKYREREQILNNLVAMTEAEGLYRKDEELNLDDSRA
ncbi:MULTISPECIES: excisionase family DNA-binding protein [unclassified Microcystis]|jgi:excisionase family DNA binding protein|uniref:Helix-turn-helix domain-containing protein n=1 Tax=Microcystis flos-aquae Mf_QC_C_20070823_S10D TaxID=2486236 RepID=A0A552KFW9_9CHRO|nr:MULTISPECIES: excisionase family DNA-binding protein [unclassified Microcystis]MCA2816125.1 excisionase family DNA-binding protein [Microcystis sp. M085S1]MCA2855150.1 excisionase family DNA-binding protein [Microcystis sp. M065S1]MCZ8307939.1 excisionase family DNA-binding protein [Microcystis sp. LE19-98.1E]TRU01199.1 MAG: helix-turn-helix domain-containing protein [Microcystis flos-aquae Ma_QC_C_20070823_S18D]TRV06870.1 MAG: helix-turn-helix domain-containing protein [Microcystis flos-aq